MNSNRKLKLVDSNVRRRAAISHALSASGFHVDPFEDVNELAMLSPKSGVILLEDRHNNITRLLERMSASGNWLPVVGFSEQPSTNAVVKAVLGGAVDYLAWPFDATEMKGAYLSAEASMKTVGGLRLREVRARHRVEKLTRRERQVLTGIAGGLSNRLIGEQLAISPRTVEIHRANMLTKMGANHTSEAIRIAIEASLVA
jgi:two-component system, LuxR family, response regulator FixJ